MSNEKVWFITGASRGFGRIWTEAALKRGDKVAAAARNPEALSDLTRRHGSAVLPLRLDVTMPDEAVSAVKAAHEHFGRLDVVVSNAGYGYMGAVEEMTLADLRANFETNVFGLFSVVQAALPVLRAQKRGHILTLSSVGGVVSFPTGGGYTATKFAVEALSEALAGEVAGMGVKVTILEPGSYNTEFRTSMRSAAGMPEYESIRAAIRAGFKPELAGDPRATVEALFKVVDAESPPLRLVLGSKSLPMFERAYAQRMASWKEWADVSNGAQGNG